MAPGKRPYRIAGTNDGEVGWCVGMKPAEEVEGPGIARFFYQNGEHRIAAMSTEVGFYQTGAHHFAAVWNHREGTMSFYFDQELIDQAALSPGAIASGKPLPFYIGTKKNPKSIGVDEFRFTQEALHPRRFLTGSSRQSVDLPRPVVAFDASQPEPFHEWDVQGDIKDPSLTKYQLGGLPTLFLNGNAFLQRKAVLNRGDDTFTFVALFSPHRLAGKQRICDQAQRGRGRRAALRLVNSSLQFSGDGNDTKPSGTMKVKEWQLVTLVVNGEPKDNVIRVHNSFPPRTDTIDIKKMDVGTQGFRLGRNVRGESEAFQGEIAELEVYDRVLSSEQLTARLSLLQDKWGLDFEVQVPEMVGRE
ncbi:MAG: LamG-like jellyroll fold domain-containing protein, partial [Verrucomicrobiota bacterium]